MTRDHQDEEVQVPVAHFKKKGKKKVGPQHKKSGKGSSSSKKKKDLSKIQCYGCQEYGHFKRDFHNIYNKKIHNFYL